MANALYELTIKRQAIKTLQGMPRQNAQRIRRELDRLADQPNRRDVDVASLTGRPGFRLRVGDWRIIFTRDDEARVIDVLRIVPRGQAYKR